MLLNFSDQMGIGMAVGQPWIKYCKKTGNHFLLVSQGLIPLLITLCIMTILEFSFGVQTKYLLLSLRKFSQKVD